MPTMAHRTKGVPRTVRNKNLNYHGKSKTPEYQAWADMRVRCLNPNHRWYPAWGGKGVTICERWDDFNNFLEDLGPRPDGFCLDRINPFGNYEPNNCRWIDRKTSDQNHRKLKLYEYNGQLYPMKNLAEMFGMSKEDLRSRLRRGWSVKKSVETPIRRNLRPYCKTRIE